MNTPQIVKRHNIWNGAERIKTKGVRHITDYFIGWVVDNYAYKAGYILGTSPDDLFERLSEMNQAFYVSPDYFNNINGAQGIGPRYDILVIVDPEILEIMPDDRTLYERMLTASVVREATEKFSDLVRQINDPSHNLKWWYNNALK